ncbi:MAG: hypothetical protein EBU59_11730, partial [Planctomycetia bacterium]|nr:hypothetical protein [Planctomycetia bacterium]
MFCRKPPTLHKTASARHHLLVGLVPTLLWASLLATTGSAAGLAEVTAVLASHRDKNDPAVTAVGLQATGNAAETAATRICILIDTSASQAGPILTQALAATKSLLAETRPVDRVLLA